MITDTTSKDSTTIWKEAVYLMNEGHSLRESINPSDWNQAIDTYGRAIDLLKFVSYRSDTTLSNSLGAALVNRGQLINEIGPTTMAKSDFKEACTVLEPHIRSDSKWPLRNYAGALINLANLFLDQGQYVEAKKAAERVISLIDANNNSVDAELAILARRCACDATGFILPTLNREEQATLAECAINWCQEALKLIRSHRETESFHEPFAELSDRIFRYGSRLIAQHEPKRLSSFVISHLRTLNDTSLRDSLIHSAKESINLGLDALNAQLQEKDLPIDQLDQIGPTAYDLKSLNMLMDQPITVNKP